MKQAYLITAHQYPIQLIRLVNKLDSPNANFYIHIDNKVKDVFTHRDLPTINNRPNVHIYQFNNVYWGGFSQVDTTLFLLREAMKNEDNGYFHLLSGLDYPLKSKEYIENFFENSTKDYLCYIKEECKLDYFVNRYYFYDTPCMDKRTYKASLHKKILFYILLSLQRLSWLLVCKFKLRIRKSIGMKYYHGSNWFSFTRNAVDYILSFIDKNSWILKRFHYTAVCDESFFTMILMNDEQRRSNIVNDDLRLRCANGMLYKGQFSRTTNDYELIQRSHALFGRKFIPKDSDELIKLLDKNSNAIE